MDLMHYYTDNMPGIFPISAKMLYKVFFYGQKLYGGFTRDKEYVFVLSLRMSCTKNDWVASSGACL